MFLFIREFFNNYIFLTAFAFALAFAITVIAIPAVIKVAELKHLFDEPDQDRKKHSRKTPTLGGIAIFAGVIIAFSLLKDFRNLLDVKYLVPALIVIFFAGIKDDILVLTPIKKLLAQFISAFLIVFLGNIKINSFYGMFGLQEMPGWIAVIFTILAIITIINCYNLIDGADGLAGSLGMLSAVTFGIWFGLIDHWSLAFLSFALAGSLFGFLFFNWQPAKIFMGDTGAMLVGFILAVLSIHFIELNKALSISQEYWIHASPAVAIGIMSIPIFDMIRVFGVRVLKRKSPFNPDRIHLHHLLIDLGFSHRQLAFSLFVWNLLVIAVCFALRDYKSSTLLFILIAIIFVPSMVLLKIRNRKISKLDQTRVVGAK